MYTSPMRATMKDTLIRIATAFAVALGIGCAQAQGYPAKPVRLVVGFPPGGGTDVVARIILPKFSEYLGQPVVIENRPGATGTVAAGMVAKSPPDGYMLMMGHVSVNAIAPSLFKNLQCDVLKDFAPVILTKVIKDAGLKLD
jgi:tripartite-type tricarboxylate transporter receptor subunit TctC